MAHRIKKKTSRVGGSKRPKWQVKVVRYLWLIALLLVLGIGLLFTVISFQNLPSFEELENPDFDLATTVYSGEGKELGRYYVENRVMLTFDQLNPLLVESLIATEDARYYKHSGIDAQAIMRVAIRTILLGQTSAGGGSTISQQLAKLLFPREDLGSMGSFNRKLKLFNTKFKEWLTAVKLEKSYTKEEILSMYLNEFDFINGAHGIHSAAETYFGKDQSELNVQEAAMLIGMLKNPSRYNPRRFPDLAQNRRNTVLMQLVKADKLNEVTYDSLQSTSVDMSHFLRSSHITGPAPYLRSELAKEVKSILQKPENFKSDGTSYNIYRDGLKVFTTIDYEMQVLAEEVMIDHMITIQERFFNEWKRKDPWTYYDEKIPVDLKKEALKTLITTSERYQKMKMALLGDHLAAIEEKYQIELRDIDIKRMISEEKKKGSLTRLIANKMIDGRLADKYRAVLKSEEWSALSNKWPEFEEKVDEAFNKEVKMKVFAYTEGMEKDTVMTPLDSIKYHRMHLQTGILAIDPRNGRVKTWVGGINHKYFKYDHIKTDRQVGSTFKPFVYASAIFFKGISPCFNVEDVPYTVMPGEGNFNLLDEWTPKNADGKYTREKAPLYDCLRKSKNTASVYLMKQLGDANLVRGLAHNMGLDSSKQRSDGEYRIPNQPSICLGSADLTVWEMTAAYSTFANNGVYNTPYIIDRIEDKNGKVIYSHIPHEQIVLGPKANFIMVDMLRYATSVSPGFSEVTGEFGGKTGTTNDHTDGWFMGITPDLVVGTWVGGEDRWIRYLNFSNGQGSRMARPFFSKFLTRLQKTEDVDYDPTLKFYEPETLDIEIDCEKYAQFEQLGEGEEVPIKETEEDFGEDL